MNRRGFLRGVIAAAAASALPGVALVPEPQRFTIAGIDAVFDVVDPRDLLLTYQDIMREACRVLALNIERDMFNFTNRQYDATFAPKEGDTLRIRAPQRYRLRP